jgi:signal transduction histidine kinase
VNGEGTVAQMVAVVSHDLKAPLSTIRLAASYLADELIPDVEARRQERRNVQIIQRSVERMTRLIDDLLAVNTATSGRFRLVRSRQSIDALIDDAVDSLRPLAQAKGVELRTECSATSCVFADRERMLQVFTNLGGNAIKFTPAGGQVTIRVSGTRGVVRFEITDTGPGIAPAHLPRVFERYWQAEDTAGLGHGLGLSIAKAIVEAHGGHIGVSSTLGNGSSFYFTIPTGGQRELVFPGDQVRIA